MSEVPDDLRYNSEHEWVRVEGDEIVIGITDYAQEALTDIVYVELPEEGLSVKKMEEFAAVDSVKSSSAIFSPISGEVISINEELEESPELINSDPYGNGWIARMRPENIEEIFTLLSPEEYSNLIK